jgi:hypothetical protein
MNTEAEIKREIETLINESPNLLNLTKNPKDRIIFGDQYQLWYSQALKLVELLGPDRFEEFVGYYRINPKRKNILDTNNYVIQDYINYSSILWFQDSPNTVVYIRLLNQIQILQSLKSRLSSVLKDVRGHLFAQIEDEELRVANKMISVSLRGAGAIAGVVLEGHLKRVIVNHKVSIKTKCPNISDLNDPLKKADVYDLPTWRKIQHLADIRNYCDHKKEREPTESEVVELVSGVDAIIKTIY